jgi:hypothetical protein
MMDGIGQAASIIIANSTAAALIVYGTMCGCSWAMNACWLVAIAFLYAPALVATRVASRDTTSSTEAAP